MILIIFLQYPQGKNAAVSYGLLTSIDKYEIKYTCSTENDSSGSPILNLETNKVIGIHKGGSINFKFNKGTYLKYILIDFIQNNKNKIKEKQYNINNNNVNIHNNDNYNNMNLNNFNIEGNNFLNQLNNIKFDDEIYDDGKKPGLKYSVIFKNQFDNKNVLLLKGNRTVDEMLTAFLKKIKKPEFIGQKNDPYSPIFIYNNSTLSFGDKTLILKLFKSLNPIIIVLWQSNIISVTHSQNNKWSKIKDCRNYKNIICKLIKHILILTILFLIYCLKFEKLDEKINSEWYIKYRWIGLKIKQEVFSFLLIESIIQIIIQIIIHKYISKFYIIHIIFVLGYYYYRIYGLNFHEDNILIIFKKIIIDIKNICYFIIK